jgi:HAD superfamily hydrolase (TIGR01490 family)
LAQNPYSDQFIENAPNMSLTLFDLDNTLITDDSDFLWGRYLVDHNIVDPLKYEEKNRQFFEDYEQGNLDIDSYLRFSLEPLTQFPVKQLYQWRAHFVESIIQPLIATGTPALLQKHREQGDTLMIISATNLFVTEPIAALLGIEHILSTVPEIIDGEYTGNYLGTPTFQQGKVSALEEWMSQNNHNFNGSRFYSDSHNDLPLLEQVDYPVAVNPDNRLAQIADERNWPILDLRT